MARFKGVVQGGRGVGSRLGHKTKGLTTIARSYSGDVFVRLYVNDEDVDCAVIRVENHHSNEPSVTLYHGPIADMLNKDKHAVIVQTTIGAFAPELLVS